MGRIEARMAPRVLLGDRSLSIRIASTDEGGLGVVVEIPAVGVAQLEMQVRREALRPLELHRPVVALGVIPDSEVCRPTRIRAPLVVSRYAETEFIIRQRNGDRTRGVRRDTR